MTRPYNPSFALRPMASIVAFTALVATPSTAAAAQWSSASVVAPSPALSAVCSLAAGVLIGGALFDSLFGGGKRDFDAREVPPRQSNADLRSQLERYPGFGYRVCLDCNTMHPPGIRAKRCATCTSDLNPVRVNDAADLAQLIEALTP